MREEDGCRDFHNMLLRLPARYCHVGLDAFSSLASLRFPQHGAPFFFPHPLASRCNRAIERVKGAFHILGGAAFHREIKGKGGKAHRD